jgi:acylphosphatase
MAAGAPCGHFHEMLLHLRITGRVQGVGFRHYLTRAARQLGLSGWVRNRSDGSVEAVVCGSEEAVQQLLAWSRRGPSAAFVERVESRPWDGEISAADFMQRPTI